jgi:hypothetical protein
MTALWRQLSLEGGILASRRDQYFTGEEIIDRPLLGDSSRPNIKTQCELTESANVS